MEQPSHFFRMGKVQSLNGGLIAALKHNKRTLEETAPKRAVNVLENYALCGDKTPEELYSKTRLLMAESGITKLRKNAVEAVEIVFSLPSNWTGKDHSNFFLDCMEWTKANFKGWLISFDVHLDEGAPHAHALILPLVDGRMIGSDMVGFKPNLNRLRESYYANVGRYYGLARYENRKLTRSARQELASKIFDALIDDSIMTSSLFLVVKELIREKPERFAEILAIKVPSKLSDKTFVQIMTSKGKGKNYEPKPIYRELASHA